MVDIKTTPKTLRSLVDEIENKKYNFELPIQRREGIWSTKEKSLFIDTLLRDYPVYPALVNKHSSSKELDVVDFKQRFNAIADFAHDNFKLSKDLKMLVIDGIRYEIANKKFSELHDDVKAKFYNRELSIITMTDATEEEISDIFERINMGHQLSNGQKRSVIQSKAVREFIFYLANHPFFEKVLSPAQFKRNLDRDLSIQSLMLIEKTDENNFASFRNVDMNKFIEFYNEKVSDSDNRKIIEEKIDMLTCALNNLNDTLPDGVKIKTSTIPMCIYGMYLTIKENKPVERYVEWLNGFLESYNDNTEYLQYCSNGTTSAENVNGRLQFFVNAVNNL